MLRKVMEIKVSDVWTESCCTVTGGVQAAGTVLV